MMSKATHKEIHQQLPDYVLGLLTPGQSEAVADHLVGCASCREAVLVEREIGTLVRGTVAAATRPDPAHLSSLMPAVPRQAKRGRSPLNWSMRLAPALVLLAVILGSFLMRAPDGERPMSLFNVATATATSTNTPTATAAQESTEIDLSGGAMVHAAPDQVAVMAAPAAALAAPAPILSPTPIVASSQMAAN